MPATLTVIRGPDVDRVYRIEDAQTVVLGRSIKCDVRIPDGQASRTHCKIERLGDHWTVTDLNSRNGTFVNKDRVTTARIGSADLLRIGSALYEFSVEGDLPDGALGSTEVLVEPDDANLDVFLSPEDVAPSADAEPDVCVQCGRELTPDSLDRGDATSVGGRLYCSRCVVHHSDSGPADAPSKPDDPSDSSEMQSLLESLERATQADRAGGASEPPPRAPEPAKRKPGLLDRLRGKKPKE